MKKLQYLILLFGFALMGYSSVLHAEDTDLYVANATNLGTPNVLFIIDNGADFSANASIGCSAYADGSGAPSAGIDNTAGVLQCSLVNAIQSLQDQAVNIGIMVSNANNFADTRTTTDPTKGGYHEVCAGGGNGGCLLRKLTPMDSAGKANLIAFIKGWQIDNSNGGNTANQFRIKVNSSYQAETMQEAWAYFNGKTGLSGTNYRTSILASGCQGNFIVYISNTQKDPNKNEAGPAFSALSAPQVGATADQLAGITGNMTFKPPICGGSGTSTIYTLTTGNNWADEWARLMNQQNGAQSITTYSIGIESSGSQCSKDTFGLVASMADVGGGEFFRVSSVNELTDSLNRILNQVQAVNSVFSSASLPVSVNADGSYLNQIYLGMFRPDATGSPRWLGNLKQYHLIKNDVGKLVQGDAKGVAAINPNTGFIDPSAVSFWTKKDTTSLPDSAGGFWKNARASQGVAKSPYDSPDGEVVEKGGVSQQLRLESLTADFSATAQTSSNPRRMYVYCPDGSATCSRDLTAASNQFSTANAGIASDAFGTDSAVPVSSIVRTGTTAVVTTTGNHGFATGTNVTIRGADQPEYNVSQSVTVNSSTTFTITGLPNYPKTPATGRSITASSGTSPDRNTLIRWIRGEDNFGSEKGPGGTITVRPSVHGDVLHSRPQVINYGDSRGIVVFYGSNDGVYRAVNGSNKMDGTGNIAGVPPGGELWGLVMKEHFGQYNRQRLDSPELKFPSTTLASARPKDYFADGQTAAYQRTKADGTIDKAYIYITMRRGGRFIYALDVSNPVLPTVMWRIANTDPGFEELGQTWSRPRATLIEGGNLGTNPMLVFGAGYDSAQDSQPPATDTMGRGIYIVNAVTGALVWQANSTCTTSATCLNVPGMTYSVPSDIAFVDRNGDGFTDKLYFGDMGGNIWRVDVADPETSKWKVTRLASLGCAEGTPSPSTHVCADGTAPRKFFFPPAVLPTKGEGEAGSFDAISIPSGDREHPLLESGLAASAYNAKNKFFLINDSGTTRGTPVTQNLTLNDLFDATSTQYSGQKPGGFYITFETGEKGVNAPLATNGLVFFATNRPIPPDAVCSPNLGEAKAYAVSPFLGTATTNLIVGGGLPPSPVAGLITVSTGNPDDPNETSEEKFCIGCAAQCTKCSALENSPPLNAIPKNVKRTYWYKK